MNEIAIALETRLAAMSGVLPTQHENEDFTIPETAYQRVDFIPGAPDNPALGTQMYREIGIMQVTLMYPMNGGSGSAYVMAQAIREWFPRGSTYVDGGVTVMIERTPAIGPGRPQLDRFVLPVSIRYFANIVLP